MGFVLNLFRNFEKSTKLNTIMEKDLDLKSAFNVVSAFGGRRQEESEKERLLSALRGKDISEVVNLMLCNGNTYNRRILRFFR